MCTAPTKPDRRSGPASSETATFDAYHAALAGNFPEATSADQSSPQGGVQSSLAEAFLGGGDGVPAGRTACTFDGPADSPVGLAKGRDGVDSYTPLVSRRNVTIDNVAPHDLCACGRWAVDGADR